MSRSHQILLVACLTVVCSSSHSTAGADAEEAWNLGGAPPNAGGEDPEGSQ